MTSLRVALIAFATDVNHSNPRVATKECFKLVATRFYRHRPFCSAKCVLSYFARTTTCSLNQEKAAGLLKREGYSSAVGTGSRAHKKALQSLSFSGRLSAS